MNIFARVFVRLAVLCGAKVVTRPAEEYIVSAKSFANHVAKQAEPWEWKRRQVIRALINSYPNARLRDLNFALEIAVRECLA